MTNTTMATELPPLDHFTRAELEELVRVLHGGLLRAQADYVKLSATTEQAIDLARAAVDAVVPT